MRVNSLFGDCGGGDDGFRAVRRLVKLNSAVQNRSVRELLELAGDECLYFFGRISSIDVSQVSKVQINYSLRPVKTESELDVTHPRLEICPYSLY